MKITCPLPLLGAFMMLLAGCSKPKSSASAPPEPSPPPSAKDSARRSFPPPSAPANAQREARDALSVLHDLRSRCDNAAYVLWHSNDYDKWRRQQTRMLSMNYSYSVSAQTPPAPAGMPTALRERFDRIVPQALETLNAAGKDFRDLATYINARDYQDDGFKKGDTLNARLVAAGKTSHALCKEVEQLYADYADTLLQAATATPSAAPLAAQLRGDLQAVQALALEMSKGEAASRATVEAMVADVSQRVEARKEALASAKPTQKAAERAALERFYLGQMEERVAVPMRKMLRETKDQPKQWAERLGDRPRSAMMQLRDETMVQMPGDALTTLQR